MQTKVNLEEILKECRAVFLTSYALYDKRTGKPIIYVDKEGAIKAMKQACKEVLALAADNAKTTTTKVLWDDPKEGEAAYMDVEIVDKQSILNTIEQVE